MVLPEPEARTRTTDPVSERLLRLTLSDPSGLNFRPSGCRSTHDVFRFCHETAIEEMFAVHERELSAMAGRSRRLLTTTPLNLFVLDLDEGRTLGGTESAEVTPSQVDCRPFQALWKGMSHPGVTWNRATAPSLTGLASVMAGSLTSMSAGASRTLGRESYLLVSREHMNLNSRLAYHFTLVDACVSDRPGASYISFRFAGGAATRARRNLRACFIEACLGEMGFQVLRRADLVNAWLKQAPADTTETRLDLLGRLIACASQLDMYMAGDAVMRWYVRQFLSGNYAFEPQQ